MALANLYLEKVDLVDLNWSSCGQCGHTSCNEFTNSLRNGTAKPCDCPFLSRSQSHAIETTLKIPAMLPDVPMLVHPRPGFQGLVELNNPSPDSLILVSGNNEYTEQILMTVLGTTAAPFFILFVDTEGNTVDMSMVFKTLTAERVQKALRDTGIENRSGRKEIIIPGLAFSLKDDIEGLTGWQVKVGPVCAAGLPVFLSDIWA